MTSALKQLGPFPRHPALMGRANLYVGQMSMLLECLPTRSLHAVH